MEEKQITNPIKAIRAKCLDCAYTSPEVALCPCTDCPLYPFRFGKNPYRKEKTPEQKAQARESMKRLLSAKTVEEYHE